MGHIHPQLQPPISQHATLQWIPGRRSGATPDRRLRRGLTLIVLVGGAALAYLCLLVRISSVDVACHRLETRCEELRTTIATDMTELSALSDTATNLDRAQSNGLCPPEGEERLAISPELCRAGGTEAGDAVQATPSGGTALPAGMGAYLPAGVPVFRTAQNGRWGMTHDLGPSFSRRVLAGRIVAGLFCAAVLLKLGLEQTYLRESRLELAAKIVPSPQGFEPGPGPICASGGEHLADSVVRYTIWADPAAYRSVEERQSVAELLSQAARVPYQQVLVSISRPERRFCYVSRRADRDTMTRVASLDLPGVHILPEIGRVYPFGKLAANAIGCRGAENQGLEGIEGLWKFVLDGRSGSSRADQDYCGRTILGSSGGGAPPEPGDRVILTIQLPLQRVVEAEMDNLWAKHQPECATCTVLDPRTGDILALSVRPNYDPNELKHAMPEMRKCRQAFDVYSPGSTLKTVIVAAALDYGVINEDSRFYCGGTTVIGDRPLGCWGEWRARGHGSLTPAEVIAKSCNICAAQIALRLGPDRLYEFIRRMHLQETMDSGLDGERPGVVLPKSEQRIRGIANIGFGQGIDVTDLHLLAWYGALANGGRMYYPNVVREVRAADGALVRRREPALAGELCRPETARIALKYLEGAVMHGTGAGARIAGVRVGGKTGTAQIYDVRQQRHLENEYVMSFIAVAPIEAPRFVVLVRVTKPKFGEHGSDTAVPTAKRVLEAAFRLTDGQVDAERATVRVHAAAPGHSTG